MQINLYFRNVSHVATKTLIPRISGTFVGEVQESNPRYK